MTAVKSMTDIAYEIMSKKKRSVPFNKLWEEVAKLTESTNDYIAQFYSDLILDSRFVSLKDNKWDLKERRKFEETHIDLKEIEIEDEDEDLIVEDDDDENNDSSQDDEDY